MKTTVDIDDDLIKTAKKRAIDEGTTLRALVERGLRRELQAEPTPAERAQRLRRLLEEHSKRLDLERGSLRPTGEHEEEPSWRADLYEEHLQDKMREDEKARAGWRSRRKLD